MIRSLRRFNRWLANPPWRVIGLGMLAAGLVPFGMPWSIVGGCITGYLAARAGQWPSLRRRSRRPDRATVNLVERARFVSKRFEAVDVNAIVQAVVVQEIELDHGHLVDVGRLVIALGELDLALGLLPPVEPGS